MEGERKRNRNGGEVERKKNSQEGREEGWGNVNGTQEPTERTPKGQS